MQTKYCKHHLQLDNKSFAFFLTIYLPFIDYGYYKILPKLALLKVLTCPLANVL